MQASFQLILGDSMYQKHPLAHLTVGEIADTIIKQKNFPDKLKQCLPEKFLKKRPGESENYYLEEDAESLYDEYCKELKVFKKHPELLINSEATIILWTETALFLKILEKALDTGLI